MYIDIYRGVSLNLQIPADDAVIIQTLPMTDIIQVKIKWPDFPDIAIKDYITHDGNQYNVNAPPAVDKESTNDYTYTVTFESFAYDTINVMMKLDDVPEFDYTGTLSQWVDIIVSSMNGNGDYGTWAKGTLDQSDTGYKTIHIKDQSCLSVLQKLQEEFNAEFYFNGLTINYTDKIDNVVKDGGSPLEIEYGQDNGLFNIKRIVDESIPVVTRVYGYGSTRNLGSDYRTAITDISKRLKFENAGVNYLDNNTGTYNKIEQAVEFPDIYPHRLGETTEVSVGGNILVFKDSAMDFDVNTYTLPGIVAEIHFNTGSLAGYSFQLEEYNNSEKQFTIISFNDVNDYELPNASLKPAIGDKFVILNISMPASYITTAETELEAATQDYLDVVSIPRVGYGGSPDNTVMETKSIKFNAGDSVIVNDAEFGLSAPIRITKVTRQYIDEYKQAIELSNTIEKAPLQRIIEQQIAQQSESDSVIISINHADLVKIIGNQIGSATIKAENIATATITSNEIAAATILAANIANATITGAKIANATITSANIANATITGSNIALATIQGTNIAAATILGTNIALVTITGTNIQNLTITAAQIANSTITGGKIASATITGGNIASGTITGGNIASLTIYAGLIQNLTITAAQIANLTITGGPGGKIAGSTLTEYNIVANTITATSIQALTITANELAANAVTASKITANSVTASKINVSTLSAISADMGTLTSGTMQTAVSGQRVVITDVDNTLRFYNSGGTNILTVNDSIFLSLPGVSVLDGIFYASASGSNYIAYMTDNLIAVGDSTTSTRICFMTGLNHGTFGVTGWVYAFGSMSISCGDTAGKFINLQGPVKLHHLTSAGGNSITNVSGDLTIDPASELNVAGNINFTSGHTLKNNSGVLTIDPASELNVTGNINIASGYTLKNLTGNLTINPTAHLVVTPGSLTFKMQTDGVLVLPNLTSNPTGVIGGVIIKNGQLNSWNGSAWIAYAAEP